MTKLLAINAIIHGLLKTSGSSPGSFGVPQEKNQVSGDSWFT